MPLGSTLFSKPVTPGLDFSGTIVATNRDDLKAGQRVLGRTELPVGGTLAEYVVVGKSGVAVLSAGVSLRDAASVGICGVTALQCLCSVEAGQKVLINGGSGGVGVFAIQTAKALGCSQITVVSSASNADLCRSLGADNVIDYKSEEVIALLKQRNEQYDIILDTVFATPDLYWQCHHYLALTGKYMCVGLPVQFQTIKTLLAIHLIPRFLGGGHRRFLFHSVTPSPEDFAKVAHWIEDGKVRPVIEEECDLEDAANAYTKLKTQKTRGKLVIRVGGEVS